VVFNGDPLALFEQTAFTHPGLKLSWSPQFIGADVLLAFFDIAAEIGRVQEVVEERKLRWDCILLRETHRTPA
jgi:hypothetical protein